MKVHAKLELDQTVLVWPAATRGRSVLHNGDTRPLANMNSGQIGASPALLLRVASGELSRHALASPPEAEPLLFDVDPGDSHKTSLSLGHRLEFPGPGEYELASEYRWDGGEVRSPPVAVQVRPGRPRAISCAPAAGGRGGDLYIAWHNEPAGPQRDAASGIWLARLTTTGRPRFAENRWLAPCPPDAFPLASIPLPGPPGRQCVVWRSADAIEFATHARGGVVNRGRVALGEGGRLIGPALEDPPTVDPDQRGFEILWLRPNSGGYELHLIPLAIDRKRQAPTQVPGPPPTNVLTTYDRSGGRMSWSLRMVPGGRGQALTELSASVWPVGVTPRAPTLLTRWPGQVVTASIAQRPDDSVYGVALINEAQAGQRLVVRRWRSSAAGFEELETAELGWPAQDPVEFGVLRVAQDGRWYALIRAARGVWGWCEGGRSAQILPAKYADVHAPVEIVFIDGTVPALVYRRPHYGLSVHSLAALTR